MTAPTKIKWYIVPQYVYEEIENPTMDRHYVANEVKALAERVAFFLQ